jgi:hypothetical protein
MATSTRRSASAETSSDRAILKPTADWRARHREALAHWGALHPTERAAGLAWGEMQNRWHWLHGVRAPEWECAGCGEPIGGLAALTLADGNRLHLAKLGCPLAFGKRWRSEADAGLKALGLAPPAGAEP